MDASEPSLIRLARASGEPETPVASTSARACASCGKPAHGRSNRRARQAGLARSTLSKIENGQMSPTYDALRKLADGLPISVPQLFTPPSRAQVRRRQAVTRLARGAPSRPRPTSTNSCAGA